MEYYTRNIKKHISILYESKDSKSDHQNSFTKIVNESDMELVTPLKAELGFQSQQELTSTIRQTKFRKLAYLLSNQPPAIAGTIKPLRNSKPIVEQLTSG